MTAAASWRDHALFAGMQRPELDAIDAASSELHYPAGGWVFREGDVPDALYYVLDGAVALLRADHGRPRETARYRAGELFGEADVFHKNKRIAGARALGEATLLRLPFAAWAPAGRGNSLTGSLPRQFVRNVSGHLAEAVDAKTAEQLRLLRDRNQMAQFFVGVVTVMSLYILGNAMLVDWGGAVRVLMPIFSLGMLVPIGIGTVLVIRHWHWDLARFGFQAAGWRRDVPEALAVTAAVMALGLLGRWVLIRTVPAMADLPLIGFGARLEMYGPAKLAALAVAYLLFAPVQEFIARGILQSCLEAFLDSRHRTLLAVLVSNMLFATLHLHVSFQLAGMSLVGGLLWGWLYARQRSLVGVSLSHALLGYFAIYVLSSRPV